MVATTNRLCTETTSVFDSTNFPLYWPVFHQVIAEYFSRPVGQPMSLVDAHQYMKSVQENSKFKLQIATTQFEATDKNITDILSVSDGRAVFMHGYFYFKYEADCREALMQFPTILEPTLETNLVLTAKASV